MFINPTATATTTATSTATATDTDTDTDDDDNEFRDIHALTPPPPPPPPSRLSSNLSTVAASDASESFTTMSREFNALVLAGAAVTTAVNNPNESYHDRQSLNNLDMIGEEGDVADTNPLAIVPDTNPYYRDGNGSTLSFNNNNNNNNNNGMDATTMDRVKREEVEAKITAWQTAKVAKINNRFKREDAIISGWENEQVHKATSWMKKIERKLEDKRAKAMEKMQNNIAKAHRKAEERRASAEAKRGTKVARVLEVVNLMRAVGRPPVKRSFF